MNSIILLSKIQISHHLDYKKTQLKRNAFLNKSEWRNRTNFPIGMSDNGTFFLASADKTSDEKMSKIQETETTKANSVPENHQFKQKKNSFFENGY